MSRTHPDVLAVVNGAAGGDARQAGEAARDVLRRHAGVDLVTTTDGAQLDAVLAELGDRLLVVVGGDGSLHLVVDRLEAAGMLATTAVGLVPCGTGNDLARGLGIPLDPVAAAEVIVTGRDRHLDLLAFDGGHGVNAMHAGVGVEAAARSAPLKDRLGALAYPVGALAAGIAAEGWPMTIEADGVRIVEPDRPCLLVAVVNGPSVGGGTRLVPDADPADGLLDVVACTAVGPGARAAFAAGLAAGSHLARDDVQHVRAREVVVRGPGLRWNIDGELPEEEITDRRIACRPASWRLRVPA